MQVRTIEVPVAEKSQRVNLTTNVKPILAPGRQARAAVESNRVIALAICSLLIGAFLGTWFRVIVLPPIIVLGGVSLAAITVLQGGTASQAALPIIVFVSVLQLGYVCAAFMKHAVALVFGNARSSFLDNSTLR